MDLDDALLDDVDALIAADTRQLLPMTASAGASIRAAGSLVTAEAIDRVVDDGRPHAVVVVGGGGSRAAGDILAAVAGSGSPVPVMTFGGPVFAGLGRADRPVVAVSGSGRTLRLWKLRLKLPVAAADCWLFRPTGPHWLIWPIRLVVRSVSALGFPRCREPGAPRTLMWSLATPLVRWPGSGPGTRRRSSGRRRRRTRPSC